MAKENPITDDEIEAMLQDLMQRIADARFKRGVETQEGDEILRLAMVSPYAALVRFEKLKKAQDEQKLRSQPL